MSSELTYERARHVCRSLGFYLVRSSGVFYLYSLDRHVLEYAHDELPLVVNCAKAMALRNSEITADAIIRGEKI